MKTLERQYQDMVYGFIDEVMGIYSKCHCGAVKEPLENECSTCDHYRTEEMQDDLETARRKEQE